MTYIEKILEPDERLLYRTNRHWILFWPAATVVLVSLVLWSSLALAGYAWVHSLGAIMTAVGVFWFLAIYLSEKFEEYAVTDRRVISKKGIIRRDVAFLPLERIQTVDVRQSVLGCLLNYGTVVVHTAAETHGTTARDHISGPDTWRRQIFLAIEQAKSQSFGSMHRPSPEPADASPGIAERLRELEGLLKGGLVSEEEYQTKRKELLEQL